MKNEHLMGFGWIFVCCLVLFVLCFPTLAAADQDTLGWKLTGQIGGTTKALALDGDTLYVGSGLHIMIMDVSDPENIKLIGTSPLLPDVAEGITSDGKGFLYVSCGSGGLTILEITDPAAPVIVGSLDTRGYTENVALYGDYAVLADGPQGVKIVDVLNPWAPVTVAEAYPMAYTYDVSIKEGVAYVAGGGSGLFVVNMSNPSQPVEVGMLSVRGFQYDVEIKGNRLYAAGAWGGVSVWNLDSLLAPTLIDTLATEGWAMALKVLDSGLLVMEGASGLAKYSLVDGMLSESARFQTDGLILAGEADKNRVFALDREKGLLSFDISKGKPTLLSRWMPILDGRRVTVNGNVAYVAGGLSGMHVIDLSNLDQPVETCWYDTEGGYANMVIVQGSTAYLSTHLATRFPMVTFDLNDPLQPKRLGGVSNDEAVFNMAFRAMALNNGHIYIPGEFADGSVDVTDPTNPHVVCRIDMENPVNADTSGNLLITTNSTQLQLVDISDPADIRLLGYFDKQSTGEAIRFINATTVITSSNPGIWIVDVSNPAQSRKLSELAISGSPMEAFIDGNLAYVSTLGNGIQIVDISDLTKPVLLGSVSTRGVAYDCWVEKNRMIVADSLGGIAIYQREEDAKDEQKSAADTHAKKTNTVSLPLSLQDPFIQDNYRRPNYADSMSPPAKITEFVVTSAADSGQGTLRNCLEHLKDGTRITFDTSVFPPDAPVTIQLKMPFPTMDASYVTVDASDAGVILDGGKLTDGSGFIVFGSYDVFMGLQMLHFPQFGFDVQGTDNRIGGSRDIGNSLLGQGNLCSGNGLYGIRVGGWNHFILGNLVGTDITGTQPMPNSYGIFIGDLAHYVTVGGVNPGEGNVISGNDFTNFDSWGDHTHVISNLIGLDITGSTAVCDFTDNGLVMESNCVNAVIGGTMPAERNVISGVNTGVIFSDPNSYSNSLIGNYIGTDITGTKAVPNQTGVLMWTSGNHRVGGAAEGEGNLISGNQKGITINGYGVTDNLILGNRFGLDANSGTTLPNDAGITIDMGQRHGVIGGYTAEEGNQFFGGTIAIRIANPGIRSFIINGNSFSDHSVVGVFLEDSASDNFIQSNFFGEMTAFPVRVDFGVGNLIRGNHFTGKPSDLIMLVENGNFGLTAPKVKTAKGNQVTGIACPNALVEICLLDGKSVTPLGYITADEKGRFEYTNDEPLTKKKIVLLATDMSNNTSAFSKTYTVR